MSAGALTIRIGGRRGQRPDRHVVGPRDLAAQKGLKRVLLAHNIPAKREDVGYHVNKLPLKSKSNVDN